MGSASLFSRRPARVGIAQVALDLTHTDWPLNLRLPPGAG